VKVPESSPADDSGIDWGDAGLGAGALLGLIALGLVAVMQRRRPAPTA
jgi:MYXO-CTERM domain-containing protein